MELDRLMNELYKPNLPYASIEHMNERFNELKELLPNLPKETIKQLKIN